MKKVKAPPREDLERVNVIVQDGNNLQFLKYHRIPRTKPQKLQQFFDFLDTNFPLWRYINFYGGVTGDYKTRIYNPTHPLQRRYEQKQRV